jgi:hypothetical protein
MRYLGACLLCLSLGVPATPSWAVDYLRDVQPLLRKHCYSCHGALRQKSGLRLDHVTFIRQGGDSGPAIETRGETSRLILAIRGTGETERMPLDEKPLADQEIVTLESWIDEGAQALDEPLPPDPAKHWSFQRPVRPPLPVMADGAWSAHPIDRLLAAQHESRGLSPAAPAAKNMLLRRVYLDLIGLPPSASELHEFMADQSSDAYERVVDRLLASPQYGERWARHWMDVWRYSDWDGFAAEVRESQPNIWRWRDWIIEALNAGKPYDEMVREMLAADEIAPDNAAALRATGFLVRNWYRFNRNVWLEATVEHTSKAFLGITLNCARCHDHMYDPILQTEYYQFRAFFEPHEVRTERIQAADGNGDLVRAFDADAARPTYLFTRGNEARPDTAHPLLPAVPRALGGDALCVEPLALAPTVYYPGLRPLVQQEALEQAKAKLGSAETTVASRHAALVEARKKLASLSEAKTMGTAGEAASKNAEAATPTGGAKPPATTAADKPGETEATLTAAVSQAQAAATLAAEEMLAAAANLTAVQARIAADNAAFAAPPADNAKQLASDAGRAERVANLAGARANVMRLERELAEARAGSDDAAKKKNAATETRLAEATKARDSALAALGESGDAYTHFGEVYPNTTTGRRAALARWIASKANPLTARVAVNHMWMRHFGSPLVPTVFDFGLNGKPPTHPEILDWLAVELMDQGWRMKPVHRLIVTSAAYRMQSVTTSETNHKRDPENVYLWRMNPRRMEAEVVRDSVLHVAGGLDLAMFGPDLDQASGLSVPRRSIYFRMSKEKKVPFLEMFDSPNVTDCYRRSESVVPQQALAMVNSSLTLAQARRLAGSLAKELDTQPTRESLSTFIAAAFEHLLCRAASDAELAACLEFLENQPRRLADPEFRVAFASGDENPVKPSGDPHERARENLVHVLLNHNDFLTVR